MYLVAYDGSAYAKGALLRAVEYADVSRTEVEAYTVIPDSGRYARERDWVTSEDEYDVEAVVRELHEQVATLAPTATFEYHITDGRAPPGQIASTIRRRAIDQGAKVVFVGSENAGSIVTSVSSVGGTVAAKKAYDVHIVRTGPDDMTDLNDDRRQAWMKEKARAKPDWGGDKLHHE